MSESFSLNPGFAPGDMVELEPFDSPVGVILWCNPTFATVHLKGGTVVSCSYHMLKMIGSGSDG